ncbi:MAG: phage replisome organizer N-terminal domain-containing protein [Acutalibacteraceae bacterium]|nr:phage replisome organizer N-terminal domain-containing protein [Acutalibacteraceae bacterium]
MAEVKWIKLMTDVFDDEKILLIESLPEKDSLIVIWFKLLCLAGKQNNSGVFVFSNRMPYTDEMFATIFRRPINTVRLALATFQQYGMIDIVDDVITIPNWNKHQSLDVYEKKKARDRLYQAERRAAQKALIGESSDNRLTVARQSLDTSSDIVVSDIDIEEDKEKEEDKNILSPPKKPTKHKYGEYNNVLLTDAELEKLKAEYPDYEERIERLSSYVASTGRSYKSHYATIRNWARKDTPKPQKKTEEPEFLKKWSV